MEHCRGCVAVRDGVELVPVVRERPPGPRSPAGLPGRAQLAGSLEKSRTHVATSRLWPATAGSPNNQPAQHPPRPAPARPGPARDQ